jgi:hypothetical protein
MTIDVITLVTGIERPQHNIVPCFACGATFIYRDRRGELNGRFCSMRCQAAYDAGYTPPAEHSTDALAGWKVVAGAAIGATEYYACMLGRTPIAMKRTSSGFKIACAGCSREFESLGLRCCSDACERRYRERQANLELMAEVGAEPSKKYHCAAPGCAATIPKWRNGRKVSSSTRFSSNVDMGSTPAVETDVMHVRFFPQLRTSQATSASSARGPIPDVNPFRRRQIRASNRPSC